jgi:hypothetical protein
MRSKGEVCPSSDDYVVEQTDIEELASLSNTLRKFVILHTWLRTTRRVVMHQNYLYCKQFQCSLKDNPSIHNRRLHTALTDAHTFHHPTRRC